MDEFRRGAKEWGSKARKEENPKCRAKLKRTLPELLEEAQDEPLIDQDFLDRMQELVKDVDVGDLDAPLPEDDD